MMRGITIIDAGMFSRRRVRNLLQELPILLNTKIEVKEVKGLLESRFCVTFDGVDAYEAYRLLKREEE